MGNSAGPLGGVKIVEFAGIGPAPFAAMVLAGLGADVIRIDKPEGFDPVRETDWFTAGALGHNRRSIALDLKSDSANQLVKELVSRADGLLEGFRPGVMERLGLGPDVLMEVNPRLTFVRMTGWGQSGPLARTAGHDLDFLAITGLLNAIGPNEAPAIPLNLLGDFGGGGTMAAIGMLSGIIKARSTGQGSVVDAAIVDGVSLIGTMIYGLISEGMWSQERSRNLLDGGCPFYSIYRCADGRDIAVAALEPKFFKELCRLLRIDSRAEVSDQYDSTTWPQMRKVFVETFASRERSYFEELFDGADACVMPVRTFSEARSDPHLVGRDVFEEVQGVVYPRPAPRFEGFHPSVSPPPHPGDQRDEILEELGLSARDIAQLEQSGAFG